jgi:hypothetical protein
MDNYKEKEKKEKKENKENLRYDLRLLLEKFLH